MSLLLNEKVIAISGAQLEAFRQELIANFQAKRIVFNGANDVLVTTALNQLLELASGKANIVVADTLPTPTNPNTQYWVKTYGGQTKTSGRFIVLTDAFNVATLIGESDVDLSNYITQDQIQVSLGNDYFYRFKNGANFVYTKSLDNNLAATVYQITFTDGDVSAITAQAITGELTDGVLLWGGVEYAHDSNGDGYYVVGSAQKVIAVSALRGIALGGGGKVDDVTVDGTSVLENKVAKFETPTDAEIDALFENQPVYEKGLIDLIYPVGSIIINDGTNPGSYLTGTTWNLYATNYQVVYAHQTAGTTVSEQLPNITGNLGEIRIASNVSGRAPTKSGALSGSSTNNYDWAFTQQSSVVGAALSVNFDASKSSSVYTNNGKVRPAGITACYWKRVS